MSQRKRILICGIAQESNCFNPVLMGMSAFHPVSAGVAGHLNVKGGREYLATTDAECMFGVSMLSSGSGAPLTAEVVEYFLADTMKVIDEEGIPDGILLLMHGATMSEGEDDVCGMICEQVRRRVGEEVVISVAFDMHACVTERVARNVDYISGYWEYPHIDQAETGARAARLLWEHLSGKPRRTARAAIPVMAPAHAYNTVEGALCDLKNRAKAMVAEGRIADFSIFQAQPWLDHPYVESTVVVVADEEEVAISVANELAREEFSIRKALQGTPLYTVEEIIARALENKSGKPVVLVDSADSVGAGSTGDSASVLAALLPYADRLSAATSVRDADAVKQAFELGVGKEAEFTLGASVAPKLSSPVTVRARVRSLHDGWCLLRGPIYKGANTWGGRVAVLSVGRLLIRVAEDQVAAGDLNYYCSFGIDATQLQLVAVKACTSFRAGYEPYSAEILNASTAGAACPELLTLPFERLPKPTYPFEEITEENITPAKCYR